LVFKSSSWRVRLRALQVIWWSRRLRVANGPSLLSALLFGSHGLAIYFPVDGQNYCRDGSSECAYEHFNTCEPLEFVNDTAWPDFLHRYFAIVWSEQSGPDPQHPHPLPTTCKDLAACAKH
jgi:hypothetical protein